MSLKLNSDSGCNFCMYLSSFYRLGVEKHSPSLVDQKSTVIEGLFPGLFPTYLTIKQRYVLKVINHSISNYEWLKIMDSSSWVSLLILLTLPWLGRSVMAAEGLQIHRMIIVITKWVHSTCKAFHQWCIFFPFVACLLPASAMHVSFSSLSLSPQNTEYEYSTHISYLEIYNENGYDLLDPKHEASKLEDLPWVMS